MKKKQSPKSTELSLLQLNFHSNVYVAPTVALGIRYSNSAVSLPRVCCFVRGLRCSISGFGEEFKSSGVDGGTGGALQGSFFSGPRDELTFSSTGCHLGPGAGASILQLVAE